MKTQATRLAQVERKAVPRKRQFVGWAANPWTPEQEAEAIRREPKRHLFWRSILQERDNR